MGIAPYKTFTFDGVSSSAYGVYLTGEGVFNAPERAVEMLSIPGRNGSFALDQGRFNNIEVTYKAGMYDVTDTNFATKVANLRNWLCSKKGYIRLSDDYNPNEYRMAVYKSGLEVEHEGLINGEFDLVFECKPQRWLTSGETASAVANNGTLSNPTLFPSSPLLAVKGYGNISFNGFSIDVQNVTLGDVVIADNDNWADNKTYTFDKTLFNNGDNISVSGRFYSICTGYSIWGGNVSINDSNNSFSTTGNKQATNEYCTTNYSLNFVAGTNSTITNTLTVSCTTPVAQTWTITQTIQYNASAGTITMSLSGATTTSDNTKPATIDTLQGESINISGNSTMSALGNPTYIDCDIGECYMIKNSNIVSLNGAIDLGSELPTLASGTNTFTYDNTITELKVTPRWWQV